MVNPVTTCWRLPAPFWLALDRFLSSSGWKRKSILAILTISLLRAFPSYDALRSEFVRLTWRHTQVKVDNPLADMGRIFPPESHESKLTFRLTAPVAAHALHLGQAGELVLFGLAGVLLLYKVLTATYTITSSKRAAFCLCLAIACVWPGVTAFHELRGGYYDAVALCFLVLTVSSSSPLATSIFLFIAAWTDERALLASPLLFLFWMTDDRKGSRPSVAAKATAMLVACAGYIAIRMYLAATHSLITTTEGMGWSILRGHARLIPMALWTGLGASWMVVAYGLITLWGQRRHVLAAGFFLALGLITGVALCVGDMTRTMAYCLPAVLVGMNVLSRTKTIEHVESLAAMSGAISLVVPTYYVEGGAGLWWLYPFPVQLGRWLR